MKLLHNIDKRLYYISSNQEFIIIRRIIDNKIYKLDINQNN